MGAAVETAYGEAEDRHGIRDSIEGRMQRIGGTARTRSTLGEGTEVTVSYRLPVS
ncbi:hypothetical protein [Corynebacterium nasicanis]|uniref:Uncharacterized protein n=1 Tax=Corynebacterium nasicanis TaxID=1448267 RepID=A0ABW1QGR3_9CORY